MYGTQHMTEQLRTEPTKRKTTVTNVWLLTREHNDYDQHGEYFIAVFAEKPTIQQLIDEVKDHAPWSQDIHALLKFYQSVLDGRGKTGDVNIMLKQIALK